MLFLIAEHVDSEGEAVGGVQGRRPGLDHRSRLHSSLDPFLLVFPMRILWSECDTVIEEMENSNLTNTTPYLQACMDCGFDSRLYAWIC